MNQMNFEKWKVPPKPIVFLLKKGMNKPQYRQTTLAAVFAYNAGAKLKYAFAGALMVSPMPGGLLLGFIMVAQDLGRFVANHKLVNTNKHILHQRELIRTVNRAYALAKP
ncbi:MAG: hypothetical protein AAF988_03030 [Pseudomonadota bacterium]